eukprot:scpid102894/ scgid3743/ Aquaporin TIP4-3; Tonoplast intrinsic protein 4-3; ZmTIP4-3; ZmTIP4
MQSRCTHSDQRLHALGRTQPREHLCCSMITVCFLLSGACSIIQIPYTGVSINPARSLGPALISGQWQHHWVCCTGDMARKYPACVSAAPGEINQQQLRQYLLKYIYLHNRTHTHTH